MQVLHHQTMPGSDMALQEGTYLSISGHERDAVAGRHEKGAAEDHIAVCVAVAGRAKVRQLRKDSRPDVYNLISAGTATCTHPLTSTLRAFEL